MTVRLEVSGIDALVKQIAALPNDVQIAVGEEMGDIAAELEADVVLAIQQGAKTGRIYNRGGVVHQASAPGESPASDTGALMGSIYSEQDGKLSWTVGSRIVYSTHLEYGTRNMAARPFFRPAVEELRVVFDQKLEAAIARALS